MKFTAMAGDLDTAAKVNRRVVGQRDVINTSGRFTDVDAGSGRPPARRRLRWRMRPRCDRVGSAFHLNVTRDAYDIGIFMESFYPQFHIWSFFYHSSITAHWFNSIGLLQVFVHTSRFASNKASASSGQPLKT